MLRRSAKNHTHWLHFILFIIIKGNTVLSLRQIEKSNSALNSGWIISRTGVHTPPLQYFLDPRMHGKTCSL